MNFIERNDQFSENLMLADDQGNRITYGEFERYMRNDQNFWRREGLRSCIVGIPSEQFFITGAVLGIMWFLCF